MNNPTTLVKLAAIMLFLIGHNNLICQPNAKAKTDLEFVLAKNPNFPNAQNNLQAVKSRM